MGPGLLKNPVPNETLRLSGVVDGTEITSVLRGNCSYPFEAIAAYQFKEVSENILADCDIIAEWQPERLYGSGVDAFRLINRKNPDIFVDFECVDGQFVYDVKTSAAEVPEQLEVLKCRFNRSYYQRLGLNKPLIARMLEVERMHQSLSYIGLSHLADMVRRRVWDECPIEAVDVLNYQRYMHPRSCIGCCNGKRVAEPQVRSRQVVYKSVGQSLCMDLVFLTTHKRQKASDGAIGLLCVDSYSLFKTIVWIKSKHEWDVLDGIEKTILIYRTFKHKVREVRMDNEGGAVHMQSMLALKFPGVVYNPSLPYGHVALVESTIRYLKSLWRSTILGVDLNGAKVPSVLYKSAFNDCIASSNIMLTVLNDYISPHDMFYNVKACYRNYRDLKWGDLVTCKSTRESEKDDHSRVDIGIIVGRQRQHDVSGFQVFNVETGKVVTRGNCQRLECNQSIRQQIESWDRVDTSTLKPKPGLYTLSKEGTFKPIMDDVDLAGDSYTDLLKQANKEHSQDYDDGYFVSDVPDVSEELLDIRDEILSLEQNEDSMETQARVDDGSLGESPGVADVRSIGDTEFSMLTSDNQEPLIPESATTTDGMVVDSTVEGTVQQGTDPVPNSSDDISMSVKPSKIAALVSECLLSVIVYILCTYNSVLYREEID